MLPAHSPRRRSAKLLPRTEDLESRLCLATSVGWDGAGLGSASLTYYIGGYAPTLGSATTTAAIKTALGVWSSVARISFTQTDRPNLGRSLDFTFIPMDGPRGTLAEGYYPDDVNRTSIAGDVQFDSQENWEVGNGQGSAAFDFVLTAVHEIGHALGLDHSNAPGAIMAATVSADESFSALNSDDINAIRRLYAPSNGTPVVNPTPTTPTPAAPPTSTTTRTPILRFPRARRPRVIFRPSLRANIVEI